VNPTTFIARDGVAIDGNDPVSYLDGAPQQGSAQYALHWAGLQWRFASAENRARFEQQPQQFVPQYGGHCSLAMSLGQIAPGSPSSWTIHGGKLYFHNSAITAFLFKYLPGRLRAADQRWAALANPQLESEVVDGQASL